MKKLLFIIALAFIGQQAFSQESFTKNNPIAEQKKGEGMTYLGSGEYKMVCVGGNMWSSPKKCLRKAKKKIEEVVSQRDATYKITGEVLRKAGGNGWAASYLPEAVVTFRMFSNNGMMLIDREHAKKELLDLKKLKDEGIIDKYEYAKAVVPFKKILLGE